MKILLAVITLLILLALDFLAMLDIIKGEPDLTAEYGIIAISAIAAIGLVLSLRCGRKV